MPVYKFDVGNSSVGPIGMVARIKADTKDQALERLQSLLPDWWGTSQGEGIYDLGLDEPDEYITVYFGADNLKITDIDESETEDD